MLAKGKIVKDSKGNPIKIKRKKGLFYYVDKEGYVREMKPKRKTLIHHRLRVPNLRLQRRNKK